jgi:hypothetical protein
MLSMIDTDETEVPLNHIESQIVTRIVAFMEYHKTVILTKPTQTARHIISYHISVLSTKITHHIYQSSLHSLSSVLIHHVID